MKKKRIRNLWKALVREFMATKEPRRDRKTTDWYRARLKHWVKFAARNRLKPGQVRTFEMDTFFGQLKTDGYKYSTRQGTLTALKAFFNWMLVKQRMITLDPFIGFEPLTKERNDTAPIPLSFAYRMIRAAEVDPSPYGVRDAAMMRFLLTTGARREEVVTISLEEINLELGAAMLIGKFDHRRVAPLRPTLVTALRRWLAARPQTVDPALFVSLHPDQMGHLYHELRPNAMNDIMVKWRDRAALPKQSVSPHKWRHRFATEMKRAGDPFSLQVLMGHMDISTTRRYVHPSPEELLDLVLRFGPDLPLE